MTTPCPGVRVLTPEAVATCQNNHLVNFCQWSDVQCIRVGISLSKPYVFCDVKRDITCIREAHLRRQSVNNKQQTFTQVQSELTRT